MSSGSGGLEISSTEILTALIAAEVSAPVRAGKVRISHVLVVECLEEQERGELVSPEETVAGILQLVLVRPEPPPLVGVHQVLVRFRLRQTGFEFLELLLALSSKSGSIAFETASSEIPFRLAATFQRSFKAIMMTPASCASASRASRVRRSCLVCWVFTPVTASMASEISHNVISLDRTNVMVPEPKGFSRWSYFDLLYSVSFPGGSTKAVLAAARSHSAWPTLLNTTVPSGGADERRAS